MVQVYDVLVRAGAPLIVMELVEGPSAGHLLRGGPVAPLPALRIAEHVARALAAAAEAGVIHRDVKPENVLLDPRGIAKLTDFGIAKDLQTSLRSLTLSGVGLGTLAYMAPEAISEAKHVDAGADLYSLGATLYHLLAGRPPFEVRRPEELSRVLDEEPAPVSAYRLDCPAELVALLAALLQKEPWDRPASALEVASQLAGLRRRHFPGAPD